jgi:hypothetical protein
VSDTYFVVVVPIRPGTRDKARALLEDGPPFDPGSTDLASHAVFLTDREVVFLFEGGDPRSAVQALASDPALWRAAAGWHDVLAGRPRLASGLYAWSRDAST